MRKHSKPPEFEPVTPALHDVRGLHAHAPVPGLYCHPPMLMSRRYRYALWPHSQRRRVLVASISARQKVRPLGGMLLWRCVELCWCVFCSDVLRCVALFFLDTAVAQEDGGSGCGGVGALVVDTGGGVHALSVPDSANAPNSCEGLARARHL